MEGYVVSYGPVSGVVCEGVQGGEVRVEGGAVVEVVVTSLEEGMEYSVEVRASNSVGDGRPSESVSVTTDDDGKANVLSVSLFCKRALLFLYFSFL